MSHGTSQQFNELAAVHSITSRRAAPEAPRPPSYRIMGLNLPLAIGAIKLREVVGYALVNLRQPPLHFGLREVSVPRVDGFELAAIDRNARLAEHFKAPAQHHKLTADPAYGPRRCPCGNRLSS